MKDDVIQLYGEASRPFEWGTTTIAPYLRLTEYVGLGVIPSATQTRLGSRVTIPLGGLWSFTGDASWMHDYSAPWSQGQADRLRTQWGLTYGKRTSVTLKLVTSDYTDVVGIRFASAL